MAGEVYDRATKALLARSRNFVFRGLGEGPPPSRSTQPPTAPPQTLKVSWPQPPPTPSPTGGALHAPGSPQTSPATTPPRTTERPSRLRPNHAPHNATADHSECAAKRTRRQPTEQASQSGSFAPRGRRSICAEAFAAFIQNPRSARQTLARVAPSGWGRSWPSSPRTQASALVVPKPMPRTLGCAVCQVCHPDGRGSRGQASNHSLVLSRGTASSWILFRSG